MIIPCNFTVNQEEFFRHATTEKITIVEGPAGSGKTHVAAAAALNLLQREIVSKVILTRAAVEATGEDLGYLPGSIEEKMGPFVRPVREMLKEQSKERFPVEVIPFSFMRGLTFKNSVVILDEAQNTTHEQMLMFLTRIGPGSRMIICGDLTQCDRKGPSGLKRAIDSLYEVVKVVFLREEDIVRDPIITSILKEWFDYEVRAGEYT